MGGVPGSGEASAAPAVVEPSDVTKPSGSATVAPAARSAAAARVAPSSPATPTCTVQAVVEPSSDEVFDVTDTSLPVTTGTSSDGKAAGSVTPPGWSSIPNAPSAW